MTFFSVSAESTKVLMKTSGRMYSFESLTIQAFGQLAMSEIDSHSFSIKCSWNLRGS